MSDRPIQHARAAPVEPAALADPWSLGADGRPVPRWRERGLGALLVFALFLQLSSWWQLDGYQLADSVEYMERAQSLARGEAQDGSNAVRSFGFSILLAPFFLVADGLGVAHGRHVVAAVRVFQMLLGLALIAACARIGARLGGRNAGLVAAALVAINPIFLQYSVSPVSGIASALFVALGVERLMLRGTRRSALAGGLALGAAFLMAYQTILVSVPVLVCVLLRDRKRWRGAPSMAALGFALGISFQVVLDRLTWGRWGASVGNYILENASGVIVTLLLRLGQRDAAAWVYMRGLDLMGLEATVGGGEVRQLQSRAFYITEIGEMFAWPVVLVLLLGLAHSFRRPSWKAWMLIAVLAANVTAMSLKGSKSFRLWLPLLPFFAPLAGYGLVWLAGARARRPAPMRAALGVLLLVVAAVLGVRQLRSVNLAPHGVYWTAIEFVNRRVAQEARAGPRPKLVSAYHWAVFGRESPAVELIKLPHHLNQWPTPRLMPVGPDQRIPGLDAEQRAACLAVLAEADWFLVHRPVLEQGQELFDAVNERFELVDYFWTPATDPTLGPVFVMRRQAEGGAGRRLYEVLPSEDPLAYRRRLGLDRALPLPMDFLGKAAGSEELDQRMTLLGWHYERLPASGFGWITYHWTAPGPLAGDYTIVDRLTAPDGRHAWQNNHRGGYGFFPTTRWEPGTIVREGYALLAGSHPFTDRFAPLGGPYRRADLMPVELWMTVVQHGPDQAYLGSLRPTAWGAERPLDMRRPDLLAGERRRSTEGHVESADKLVRLGRFLLPVHPLFDWPSDGRPDPP